MKIKKPIIPAIIASNIYLIAPGIIILFISLFLLVPVAEILVKFNIIKSCADLLCHGNNIVPAAIPTLLVASIFAYFMTVWLLKILRIRWKNPILGILFTYIYPIVVYEIEVMLNKTIVDFLIYQALLFFLQPLFDFIFIFSPIIGLIYITFLNRKLYLKSKSGSV